MNTDHFPSSGVLAACLSLGLALPAWAQLDAAPPSVCARTATVMFQACGFDVRDDYNVTLAHCLNLGEWEARAECRAEASALRSESQQECQAVRDARNEACELLGEDRYDPDPLLDPAIVFIDPDQVPGTYPSNPFVSVAAGHTYVLRAGIDGEETVVVHVTEDSREIQGVSCRVVLDVAVEVSEEGGAVEYEGIESTDDWFAQDTLGNVYYCGEIARNFEDGVLRDLDGSFEAGRDLAKAGVLLRAFPVAGDAHRQEFALGEAEDIVQYVAEAAAPTAEEGGDNPAFPCSPDLCLQTLEFAPVDPESSEFKYYLPGTGFVLAVAMEDGEVTGEREELVCVGDSLAILDEAACEIDDPDALRDALCELAGGPFCE